MTLVRQLTLAMVSVALLSGVVVGALVDHEVTNAVQPAELARLQTAMRGEIASLQAYVSNVRSDVTTALHAVPVTALLSAHVKGLPLPAAEHGRIVELYSAILSAKQHYLLLRLIAADGAGRELVRVERDPESETLRLVPEIALQNKGDRPYMRAALSSRDNDVYVSPIELRQDHGQVSVPHVPVLRAAIPNYSEGYARDGVVVLTVDMGPALAHVQRALAPVTHALYLFDRTGNFMLHPEPGRAFGRDLGTREDFMSNFPELQGLPQITEPWTGSMRNEAGEESRLIAIPFKLADGPELVLLAGGISTAGAVTRGVHRAALMAALGAGLLGSLLALLFSRHIARPITLMTSLAERYPGPFHAEGDALPVSAAGEVGSLARALARMETQIRERNERIEQEEARFRRVFESVPYATLIVDQDQRIVLANGRAETVFGRAPAELLGGELDSLIPEATRAAHSGFFSEYLSKPGTRPMAMGRAVEIRRKDGSTAHVEIGLAPLSSASRNEVLASIVDVSDRVRSEAALRQSNRELEQFAYVASHDLQEPLRMVANYCELLARRYEGQLDEKAHKYIHFAVDGARRMQKLISDLLAYSRVESQGGSFARVDLNVIVKQVLQSLQVAAEEAHASVTINPLPTVMADTTQMQQLFQNLLDNAIKFRGDRPPRIVVSATQHWTSGAARAHNENADGSALRGPFPDRSQAASNDNQGKVRISIQDNGIGVDMQNAHRLFEMFQRGHGRDRFAGTGIGLAVSKRVVERHGGTIWVEPSPSGGTTFCFTLELPAGRRV